MYKRVSFDLQILKIFVYVVNKQYFLIFIFNEKQVYKLNNYYLLIYLFTSLNIYIHFAQNGTLNFYKNFQKYIAHLYINIFFYMY